MGKISENEQDEIESKIIKVKGGPGLILISFGIILFLAGMQIDGDINGDKIVDTNQSDKGTPTPTPTLTPTPTSKDCFDQYFSEIPEDRLATAFVGAKRIILIRSDQSKDELMGLNLKDNGQSIGAIKLNFIYDNEFFIIQSVVDSNCQEIEEYYNSDRPRDKNVLQNFDTLRIIFGNDTYELRLGYSGGTVEAHSFSSIAK